ncbi:MAG: hypothetical protein A3J93_03395 [Candidatus Magasanikbacteria bacterium RIFOXYC2_FULL_42_28]|uniref:DNA helicase UvrD n=1 Tax=Candidatus Magasanikbacteria bacterium RIFOXYC2_FULL_42_28 TaxID=1798704 RepID=A0A1F6NUF2_9BACT|nr:MAG: hypothetical protein A3J93_03395 [Candidatus Magasanikbacteria bacterium RIFOXYC2_FULL_42_28]
MLIADLHIHSRYSRACSPELNLANIAKWCQIKGINLVSTGDFTHPAWIEEIKRDLEEVGNGFLKLKLPPPPTSPSGRGRNDDVRFILGTEVSCIYSQGGKTRRVHLLLFFPKISDVEKFNSALTKEGCNIRADGRPILGLTAKEVLQIMKDINPKSVLIPAHAWTPWFAVFGSKSGYDSLEECFEELTPEIFAIETGLSSDPPMNWRLSALDKITLISNSDAHSLPNLGREANMFNLDIAKTNYDEFFGAIKNKDSELFLKTIEFYPEEGMYHVDGHRACDFSCTPTQTKKLGGLCPKCKKSLTVGVLSQVEKLADRPEGYRPPDAIPYVSLVELDKIIAQALGVKSRKSVKVQAEYEKLIKYHNEFEILLDLSYDELAKITTPIIVEGIKRVREGKLKITPGFDGEYGRVEIFTDDERKEFQGKLF